MGGINQEQMEELSLVTRQEPGVLSLDNFEELKAYLSNQLQFYKNIAYTEDNIKEAKKDKAALNKLKRTIEDRRKEMKKIYMEPYTIVEGQAKELVALIDEPLSMISAFISGVDQAVKAEKRAEITRYFYRHAAPLGELAESVLNSPAFFDPKWENKTTKVQVWQDGVQEKIRRATRDVSSIRATGGKHTAALLNRYLEQLSLDGMAQYKASLDAVNRVELPGDEALDGDDSVVGYKVLRLTGSRQKIEQLLDQMELMGIEVDELEDGMPQEMRELTEPDFDSFVAFDIETTGTYGVANGDQPARITEIGAVKVVKGEIVDRFDMLADPGRKIVPRIARLTHISDEMVKGQPPVAEVIKKFKAFVGDDILVGHNIKNCDIPHILRAAKDAGVVLENAYFDTYRYARPMREAQGWESVKLEYLAAQMGITQPDAHRAWCDAEANVGVFLRLRTLK